MSNFDLKKMVPALIAVMGVAIIELKGAGGIVMRQFFGILQMLMLVEKRSFLDMVEHLDPEITRLVQLD